MDATVDAQLRTAGEAFTAADAELLRAIGETGSVSEAADRLGRSRSRALDRIETLEDAFGALVERQRGGASGGGSELTDGARTMLARFDRLRAALAGTATVTECVFPGTVTDRDGELGTVETDAGPVRALLAGDRSGPSLAVGDGVQVSIRSDAVTLHGPAEAPPADGTSARNRFEGVVRDVDPGTAVASISVDVDGPDPLVVLVTRDSLERLDIEPGSTVVATFKATATRAIGVE